MNWVRVDLLGSDLMNMSSPQPVIKELPIDHKTNHLDGALKRSNPGINFANSQYNGLYAPSENNIPIIIIDIGANRELVVFLVNSEWMARITKHIPIIPI